jgi:hypothetical protein
MLQYTFQNGHISFLMRETDDPNAAPLEFLIISLAHWFVGMLTWWIEHGMAHIPQQMTL